MKAVIRQWVRGAIVALASMAIYAVALGCYTALMLLVVSMEEGGDNLTVGTTSLTQAVVLLSEGSGFRTDSFTLTITPLLLTILLIWLINALIMRIKAYGPHAYVAGLIVWLGLNEAFRQSVHLGLVDDQWLVLLKDTALVSLIGVNEMMRQAQMASASTYQPFTWYAAAALIYLAISLVSEFGLKQASRYTRRYGG